MTQIRVEGSYRCPSCNNKLKGREEKCLCGYTGDEEIVFVNDGPQVAMSAELQVAEFSHGQKWWCLHCEGFVQGNLDRCPDCGGDHSGIFYGDVRAKKTARAAADRARLADSVGSQRAPRQSGQSIPAVLIGVVLAVCFLFGIGVWYFFFNTTKGAVQLASVGWERSVDVERYQEVEHDGWLSAMPEGARLIRQYLKHHHYDEVPDGTEWVEKTVSYRDIPGTNCGEKDMGDGSFLVTLCTEPVKKLVEVPKTRSVSVMAPYAEWKLWEWKFERTVSARGDDFSWYGPDVLLAKHERVRDGSQTESYRATFAIIGASNATTTERFSLSHWENLEIGACYGADINPLGYVIRIDTAHASSC